MAKLPGLFAKLLGNYGDDIARGVANYGDDVLGAVANYGDDAARAVANYGDDVAGLVADNSGRAVMSPELLSDDFLDAVDDFANHTPYDTGRFNDRLNQINKHLDRIDSNYGLETSYLRSPDYVTKAPIKYDTKLTQLHDRLVNEIPDDLWDDAKPTLKRLERYNPENFAENAIGYWESGAYMDNYDPYDEFPSYVDNAINNTRLQRTVDKKISQGHIPPYTVIPETPAPGSPMNDFLNKMFEQTQLYGVRPSYDELFHTYENLPWGTYPDIGYLKGRKIGTVQNRTPKLQFSTLDDDLPF